jgi:hypothetical protein
MKDDIKETVSCQVMMVVCLDRKEPNPVEMKSSSAWGIPYGRCQSEIFGNNGEVAQGLASSCMATQRTNGTDPKEIVDLGVGCSLQEGVLPCKSGMAQEEDLKG